MPLPQGFSEFEFLQDTIRRVQNKIVRDDFRDLGGDDWDPDITTGRGTLRHACTLKDEDSALVLLMRLWLYYIILKKAQDLHPAIYGVPVTSFHETLKFHPQIRLYFLEDSDRVEDGFAPVEGEITIRLASETESTINEAKAKVYATKIRSLFCSGAGFVWRKGRQKWVYKDTKRGYDFRLLATSEAEARRVIEQVLDIQSHSPDWDLLKDATKVKENTLASPIPGNHFVYGKTRRKPRHRPVAFVRFRYAELKLWGLQNDITLVDNTATRRSALVKAS